jgi:hypothetical protein
MLVAKACRGVEMWKAAYYAGMIWLVAIALQLVIFCANEFLGIWPGAGWLCGGFASCRVFFDEWYGSLFVLLVPAVPAAALLWWGRAHRKRGNTIAGGS